MRTTISISPTLALGHQVNWTRGRAILLLPLILATSTTVDRAWAAPIEQRPQTPAEEPSARRPQEVIDAIKRFQGGNTREAFDLLKAASGKYPQLSPPRVMLANLYISEHQKAQGLEQLEMAVLESPDDPEAHLIFGDIAGFERRASDAEAQYDAGRALLAKYNADAGRKSSLTSQCYLGLANVAKMRGQWDKAEKVLSALLTMQPNNATAHQRMAERYIAADKPDEALKELQLAAKADTKWPNPPAMMAQVYRQFGRAKDVEKWLNRAVDEFPNDLRARLALGTWWLEEGDPDKASAQFTAAEKLDAKSPEVKFGLGNVARLRHDDKKARQYFEAVLEQSPGNMAAGNQLALQLADEGGKANLQHALELAAANLRNSPQSADAESTLGWINYKLGKLEDAERHLRAAAARGAITRDTAYFMAKLAYDGGKRDESLRLLRQAVEGKGAFAHADEASQWLAQLTKSKEATTK
jgi:tetratricopeptide (TPR) repeat protein